MCRDAAAATNAELGAKEQTGLVVLETGKQGAGDAAVFLCRSTNSSSQGCPEATQRASARMVNGLHLYRAFF